MLDSVKNRFRTEGLFATAIWALYRWAQCLITLDVTRLVWLDGSTARFKEATGDRLTFRFLTPEEVRNFSAEPTNLLDESFAKRLEGGQHFCFAALSGEQLAAYAWFSLHSVEAECNRGKQKNTGVAIAYPNHVVFMYKGFTHPEFRGQGLYGTVNGLAVHDFSSRGITHILSTMDWSNVAARRSCFRLGFAELGLIHRWGWGRWMHTQAPRSARSLGIRVGEKGVKYRSRGLGKLVCVD